MNPRAAIEVEQVPLDAILALREEYRREMACQIVHDSLYARGMTDPWVLREGGQVVGYGALVGEPQGPRDVVKEVYLLPGHRGAAPDGMRRLIAASGARWIEAQTNDPLLTMLLFEFATDLRSETILFADAFATHHAAAGAVFRALTEGERAGVFPHEREPVGEWGIDVGGEIVATGGVLSHYNPPWADLFMEVAKPHRRRGYGRFLVQELKRVCHERGQSPAARCRFDNEPSRRTLQSAGLLPCGRIVRGRIVARETES